jgi:hypothetical protein
MTTEILVKPANIQEQLLGKISEIRQKNLTAKQKEEIEDLKRRLMSGFLRFSWNYFGLFKEEIQKLSDQEIEALFFLVAERAGKTAIYMRILGFGTPIIGWIGILNEPETTRFSNSVRKLKQMVGNGFNPTQIILSRLNQ